MNATYYTVLLVVCSVGGDHKIHEGLMLPLKDLVEGIQAAPSRAHLSAPNNTS